MTKQADGKSEAGSLKKTLSDGDIATYARRSGPSGGAPGTDVDAHGDAEAASTDHDTGGQKAVGTDKDN